MLFFDGVVRAEVRAELETRGDELFEGEVGRSFVVEAGVVEHCPGLAEVVVLFSERVPRRGQPAISLLLVVLTGPRDQGMHARK